MDIEKDAELFEHWWEDEGQYHRAGGNDYCKTFAWEAWIFAKNQAVPEGFVVVPKEPTEEMIQAGRDERRDLGTVASTYKAMIEAQEPAK